ncbi:MAG: isoaspartyl peptidase/L-asparaginase [Cardiobacteriaceae bacterium]|nr:isoaspartyl peptidase/L-asparaginase [Cardiobacteriaceae bacterium]
MGKALIAIHGGAGAIGQHDAASEQQYRDALARIVRAGAAILAQGGRAVDAVTLAVQLLEDEALFNAGRGAVLTAEGKHELDAAIMDGATLACGAVAGVQRVKNPVLAARAVMEKSAHVFLIGAGAETFAAAQGLDMVDNGWFTTEKRRAQWLATRGAGVMLDHDAPLDERHKMGTVGAVVRDCHGHLAAATSTGGMSHKMPGRVGDSPVIGAGCYADDQSCAISCTGHGEHFIRTLAAHEVAAMMRHGGLSLAAACQRVVHETLPAIGGDGGMIAIDHAGNIALPFNTAGMYRACVYADGRVETGIYKNS